jgi:hypothetical protein
VSIIAVGMRNELKEEEKESWDALERVELSQEKKED